MKFGIRATIAGVLVAGGVAVAGGIASPASAAPLPGERFLNSLGLGSCLASSGTGISADRCATVLSQRWTSPTIEGEPGDYNTIHQVRSLNTENCLTSDAGGKVFMADCTTTNSAGLWRRAPGAVWVSELTGRCLETDTNGRIFSSTCDESRPTDAQRWYAGNGGGV